MDKNTIIGFVLMAAVLGGFWFFSSQSDNKEETNKTRSSTTTVQQPTDTTAVNQQASNQVSSTDFFAEASAALKDSTNSQTDSLVASQTGKEEFYTLDNGKVKVVLSTKGGRMVSAQLKEYKKFDGDSLYLFNNDSEFDLLLTNNVGRVLKTGSLFFTPIIAKDPSTITMRYSFTESQYVDFIYKLSADDYMLKYDVNMVGLHPMLDKYKSDVVELNWSQKIRRQEKNSVTEEKHAHVNYKYLGLDVEELSADKNESKELTEPTKWIAFKDQFFATILIADEKIENATLDSKMLVPGQYLKSCDATLVVPGDKNGETVHAGFSFYMGPMSYTLLKSYDDGVEDVNKQLSMDELVPLGWSLFRGVNKYFVIPLFNILKSTGMSMGIVILLLTIIVKLIISPLTFKSFMSSAKMRVLKPQVDQLAEKFPKQEQAMEKQQATMALYRQAGVNPMSGCIPMVLQMPILFALFQFFPNAIDLRQQSFLWADDLSTYDAIFSWSDSLPLLGNHLSLFCVLMTITNIVYTKFNMEASGGQQQMPGMKWMMYLMPLIFFFMLNDFPSGLTYYYFLSLLITIVLTLAFRFTINEEKVLAKLEANKAKPKKKKSGFMARIEEAQRMQQQQARQDAKKGNKNK